MEEDRSTHARANKTISEITLYNEVCSEPYAHKGHGSEGTTHKNKYEILKVYNIFYKNATFIKAKERFHKLFLKCLFELDGIKKRAARTSTSAAREEVSSHV
jgi:hypothetical protein